MGHLEYYNGEGPRCNVKTVGRDGVMSTSNFTPAAHLRNLSFWNRIKTDSTQILKASLHRGSL